MNDKELTREQVKRAVDALSLLLTYPALDDLHFLDEADAALRARVEELEQGVASKALCGKHNTYWTTIFDNCVMCQRDALTAQLQACEQDRDVAMRQGGMARTELMLENRDLRQQLAEREATIAHLEHQVWEARQVTHQALQHHATAQATITRLETELTWWIIRQWELDWHCTLEGKAVLVKRQLAALKLLTRPTEAQP